MKSFGLFLIFFFGNNILSSYGSNNTPREIIQDHLKRSFPPATAENMCVDNSCCTVSSSEKCSMNQFQKDQSTLVLPGGNTRCIFSYSTPFAFQVIPGDSDNLLFYFQGGGACWDQFSTDNAGFCTTDASPQKPVGVFDRTNPKNAFRSYTIVHVLYCSGDVHGGNTVRSYNDAAGQPVVQVGLLNAQSAVDWVKQQISVGNLASTFSNFVIMGCSAGSIGAQLWGQELLTQFKWKQAAVVPDSYAGVFPPGSLGQLIYNYGFCSSGFLTPAMTKKCNEQTLTLEEIDLEFMTNNPKVPYTFLQSKTDAVQMSFYISVGQTTNTTSKTITPTEFYNQVNDLFGDYNAVRKNFLTYLVDGDHHCFTCYDLFFEADTKGPEDNGTTTTTKMMADWVNQLPLSSGEVMDTLCDGALKGTVGPDNTYCSNKVVPKEFVEEY
jgi:hypothetical protein